MEFPMNEFIDLTDESFESAIKNEELALIDYMAVWCGSCRMAAPMFKKVSTELGMKIFKVDAEKNPIARSHAQISTLPTLALVKNGVVVASISTTKEEGLKSFLKDHGVG
jgi:thiol-disulfide isomerase/thioredoxin